LGLEYAGRQSDVKEGVRWKGDEWVGKESTGKGGGEGEWQRKERMVHCGQWYPPGG